MESIPITACNKNWSILDHSCAAHFVCRESKVVDLSQSRETAHGAVSRAAANAEQLAHLLEMVPANKLSYRENLLTLPVTLLHSTPYQPLQ